MLIKYMRLALLSTLIFQVGSLGFSKVASAQLKTQSKIHNFYEIYITKAITNTKILPNANPIPGYLQRELNINACRGEYAPATFVIRASQKIMGLKVTATELRGEHATIPSNAVNLRVVKCWFQSGSGNNNEEKSLLTPELLLKDDHLIQVDLENKINYMRISEGTGGEEFLSISDPNSTNMMQVKPLDSDTLQPLSIPVNENKQFWITVHVPDQAVQGYYEGKIIISTINTPSTEVVLRLHVLPFELEKPCLRYAIYYRGRLTQNNGDYFNKVTQSKLGYVNSDWKTSQQYYIEMCNLKAHGIEYPSICQNNPLLTTKELEIRARAGLPKDTLYDLSVGTDSPQTDELLQRKKEQVKERLELVKKSGYDRVYIYGLDEAKGDRLKAERPAWEAVHRAGGKVIAACRKGDFELMGDLLDLAVVAYSPDAKEAEKYHLMGHQIFCYANPQMVPEEPETYRRNYGLLLWKAGYDGAMPYAYQDSRKYIWNDFDSNLRDITVAYPAIGGVIDTIQWEGFREGVNDVRYLTTLQKAIREAKKNKIELASAAQEWVKNIDPIGDLDALRENMIKWIMKLQ